MASKGTYRLFTTLRTRLPAVAQAGSMTANPTPHVSGLR